MSGSGGLCEPELPKQSVLASARAPSTDSVTHKVSDGTQGSLYKMGRYKEALTAVLDCLTCPQCKEIFTDPVTLDCGHTVCWDCAEKTGSENKEGQRCCCCPKCGVESVREDLWCRINLTLCEAAAVVHVVAAYFRLEWSAPEVRSAGDSESCCSLGTSCSIGSMNPPPDMASRRELFIRMFLPADGLGSEDGLSQRSSGFSDYSEREQRSEDEISARGSLSGAGGLCDPELPQHTALPSPRARILHLLKRMISDGTQRSVYKTSPYKQVLLHILEPFTCPHCKEILTIAVTLDCGHSVCDDCAETIGSENEEGQQCCCCPKCGAESVTKYWWLNINWTLSESVDAVREQALFLWMELRPPEARSAGDSDVGNIRSECSFFSIRSMFPPPDMAWKTELFNRMFLLTDDQESEEELSQRRSGSSECSERQQPSEDEPSARGSLSDLGRNFSMDLFKSEVPQQSKPPSFRAPDTDSVTHKVSDGTQASEYRTRGTRQALLDILDRVTCPHCKEIFTEPVTLDCGHSVCRVCAEKICSKNEEGQQCCCCPKCGVEVVTEDLWSRVNWTLCDSADVVRGHAAFLGSAGDSGGGHSMSECSFGSSYSINSMSLPVTRVSKTVLFHRLFFPTDGLESVDELSQRPEDDTCTLQSLSGYGGLCEPELPEQSAPTSDIPHSPDLFTHMMSDGTQGSVYKTRRYKEALVDILDSLTCPHCDNIFTNPVTLDCGHSVCWDCAEKIGSKNKEGQLCCCCCFPKCGVESVTEDLLSWFNETLCEVANVSNVVIESLWKEQSTTEGCSAGDSDSSVRDLMPECSFVLPCTIGSMDPPPHMVSTRELFDRMFVPTDGMESVDELSQPSFESSDCSKSEQLTEDEASAQGSLSGSWRYLFRKLFKAKLLQQSTLASARAPIMDLLTDMMSDETQGSLYITKPYKQALLDIFELLTCPHCKEILSVPVTLDCGDSFCWSCAEKICSKNKEGQRCCCSKCGWESVTEDLLSRINQTLLDVAAVARGLSASFGNGWSTSEACSEGDSEVEDMMSECSVSSFCSIGSMLPPPTMASKEKLFIRMFLTMDGLESEDKLSQQPSGSSDCTENEQRPEEETFTLQSLSGSGMYSSGGLFKSKLPEQGALASSRAHIMDLLTQMISAGTQGSKSLSEIRQPISVKFLSSSNSIPDHPAADGKLREPEISSPHGINSVKHCSRGFSPHLDCRRHVGEAQGLPFGESKVVRLYRRPSTSFSLRFL